jgi:methionyl-tRNA formyltransferase
LAGRRFQAATPEPGCFVSYGQGEQTLRILAAQTVINSAGEAPGIIHQSARGVEIALPGGSMLLETLQPAGKKAMPAADWWRGIHEEIRIDG